MFRKKTEAKDQEQKKFFLTFLGLAWRCCFQSKANILGKVRFLKKAEDDEGAQGTTKRRVLQFFWCLFVRHAFVCLFHSYLTTTCLCFSGFDTLISGKFKILARDRFCFASEFCLNKMWMPPYFFSKIKLFKKRKRNIVNDDTSILIQSLSCRRHHIKKEKE